MYRLNFYVPEKNIEEVKEALFSAGAGKIGNYEQCCWQTKGTGQFLPLKGSNPAIGIIGTVEKLQEYKVEIVCEDYLIENVVQALIESHPYEEPAYDFIKIMTIKDLK
jgi:hypothetical protein